MNTKKRIRLKLKGIRKQLDCYSKNYDFLWDNFWKYVKQYAELQIRQGK